MKRILTMALAFMMCLGATITVYAANTRTIPTSGGNRNVTYIEIPLDTTYTVGAMTAEDSFGRSAATLAEFAAAVPNPGTDTIVFPINFFIPYDGSNEVVGALVSQGRIVSADPQPWLNWGVGFTTTNRMFLFEGHISGDNIYGQRWYENRLDSYETAFNVYPWLIADGHPVEIEPMPGMTQEWMDGRVFRAFMGQRADGTLIVGNVGGTSIAELQEIAVAFDLINATNIDGGASAGIWRNGAIITSPGRQLASVAYITNNRDIATPPLQPVVAEINVTINGEPVVFDGQNPTIVDGRTLVPVRGVFEHLGFDVDWNQGTQTAYLTSADYVVAISIGSAEFTTNGASYALDVPAQIIDGRTMLPIRAVLESVGYNVGWDGHTQTVIITD